MYLTFATIKIVDRIEKPLGVADNVIGLAKVWNFLTVRPADEHIKETKFPRNDKTSQQTKSVARFAGRLENVRPKTEVQQGFAAEICSVRHISTMFC